MPELNGPTFCSTELPQGVPSRMTADYTTVNDILRGIELRGGMKWVLTRYDDQQHREVFEYTDLLVALDYAVELAKKRFGRDIRWSYSVHRDQPGVEWLWVEPPNKPRFPYAYVQAVEDWWND